MIVSDRSGLTFPDQQDAVIAVSKEIAAHFDRCWPLTMPRQVLMDLARPPGRVHIVAVEASVEEHARQRAEQDADATARALLERLGQLLARGSDQTILRRLA